MIKYVLFTIYMFCIEQWLIMYKKQKENFFFFALSVLNWIDLLLCVATSFYSYTWYLIISCESFTSEICFKSHNNYHIRMLLWFVLDVSWLSCNFASVDVLQ